MDLDGCCEANDADQFWRYTPRGRVALVHRSDCRYCRAVAAGNWSGPFSDFASARATSRSGGIAVGCLVCVPGSGERVAATPLERWTAGDPCAQHDLGWCHGCKPSRTALGMKGVKVYVAAHGEHFHLRATCIDPVRSMTVERARSLDYTPCLLCGSEFAESERPAESQILRNVREQGRQKALRREASRRADSRRMDAIRNNPPGS